jgi:hypothetical protein
LGGVLLNDTTITTDGKEFTIQGPNSKLVSGADPLGFAPVFGDAFPGMAMSTDGTQTGGLQSWVGTLVEPNNKALTVVGNFDLVNGIQAAMVAEDMEVNLYSSDGVSGFSNITLNSGSLSLSTSDNLYLYAANFINFNNFGSGRDDSGTNFPANFLYTDGSGNLQSAPLSLLGGGGGSSSLTSQDEGSVLTTTTNTYNFTGAGVTATNSGGLVTVNIPGGGGGGSDGSIYLNDGTLTGNRNLNGGGFSLGLSNISDFSLTTNNTLGILSGSQLTLASGGDFVLNSGSGSLRFLNYLSGRDDSGTFTPVNFLYTDGSGNLLSAPASLLTGGGGTNIYNSDGTLTANRTLNGGGNNLTFNSLNNFTLASSGTISSSTVSGSDSAINLMAPGFTSLAAGKTDLGKIYSGGLSIIPGIGIAGGSTTRLYENNTTDGFYSSVVIDAEGGIGFDFDNNSSLNTYNFPRADGTAGQALITDGAGQLSWQNAGFGWSLTGNSGTTAGTNFIGTTDAQDFVIKVNGSEIARFYENTGVSGSSVGLGGGIALDNNMFVYGSGAGVGATDAQESNFLGRSAGLNATNARQSNFFGLQAGVNAINANGSNFMGEQSGYGATDAYQSNFFGPSAGQDAANAYQSNFIGLGAGQNAINANNSIFLGTNAGFAASSASYSNFFGTNAGQDATLAISSNFFGPNAGIGATRATGSNFIGPNAGGGALDAEYSNFFGFSAGNVALNASKSNFFGQYAGMNADNASNSIFIGINSGSNDIVNNTTNPDDFSILLGNNTSTGGFSNSIALGSYAANTASNQLQIGSINRPITSVFIGDSKGTASTDNTFFVGFEAGRNTTFANDATFFGYQAGKS